MAAEKGAAGITIELRDGRINVYHVEGHTLLAASRGEVPEGTWDRLWDALRDLGVVSNYAA